MNTLEHNVLRIAACLAVTLCAATVSPWGTLTEFLALTAGEEKQLRTLITDYGRNPSATLGEITPRKGPHPTHQFIVKQALLLLKDDPAFQDGKSGFPSLEAILKWDGLVRRAAQPNGMNGMWERDDRADDYAWVFAPAKGAEGGPSADAEITAQGRWNMAYEGLAHYWNPWLRQGRAPGASGENLAKLAAAIVADAPVSERAHYASHLGHFVADAITPKHADVIALNEKDITRLAELAAKWSQLPKRDLGTWLNVVEVDDALAIIQSKGTPEYWHRVEQRIAQSSILKAEDRVDLNPYPDICAPSLRSAVAAYLWTLNSIPGEKWTNIEGFYGFFDPFYYNGPLVLMHMDTDRNWVYRPEFGLATPTSEHLLWETAPALGDYIKDKTNKSPEVPIVGLSDSDRYSGWKEAPGLGSLDGSVRSKALAAAMAKVVESEALAQHGSSPSSNQDFKADFMPALRRAVKDVFTAYRAGITALRVDPRYQYREEDQTCRFVCDVKNLAREPAQLTGVRLVTRVGGKWKTRTSWAQALSGYTVPAEGVQRVTLDVKGVNPGATGSAYFVDILGKYVTTPDAGIRREKPRPADQRLFRGSDMPDLNVEPGKALDLAIVFDVTGSMQGSINSVRENAIRIVKRLQSQSLDMRVALVSFRDMRYDKEKTFSTLPFTPNVSEAFATMQSWKAIGGGSDAPEDQLEGIRLALDMWQKEGATARKPTKIIVVITDADFKDPDLRGNTEKSIAALAEKVDPAHIYPIIVGSSPDALAGAERLASLTGGKVLSAADGDKVATVLLSAVEEAVLKHGRRTPVDNRYVPLVFYSGLAALVLGVAVLWRSWRAAHRKLALR